MPPSERALQQRFADRARRILFDGRRHEPQAIEWARQELAAHSMMMIEQERVGFTDRELSLGAQP